MRVGFASDIHRLVINRKLILGGVDIPFELGEEAHSDGDVVYHALSDAILGALAQGDIGVHFPDNQESTKDMDSAEIVKYVFQKMDESGYKIGNIDILITLEKPKLASYKEQMRENIAKLLHTDTANVSIKAGTNEGLDEIGHLQAVKADAIVLVNEK